MKKNYGYLVAGSVVVTAVVFSPVLWPLDFAYCLLSRKP